MKRYLFAALLLILLGCGNDPVSTMPTNNKEITVDKLFTHDGCSVYRFTDYGNSIYYVHCGTGDESTSWSYTCGKGCVHHMRVETVGR